MEIARASGGRVDADSPCIRGVAQGGGLLRGGPSGDACMHAHAYMERTRTWRSGALLKAAGRCEVGRQAMRDAGGVATLQRLLAAYPAEDAVQEEMGGLLRRLQSSGGKDDPADTPVLPSQERTTHQPQPSVRDPRLALGQPQLRGPFSRRLSGTALAPEQGGASGGRQPSRQRAVLPRSAPESGRSGRHQPSQVKTSQVKSSRHGSERRQGVQRRGRVRSHQRFLPLLTPDQLPTSTDARSALSMSAASHLFLYLFVLGEVSRKRRGSLI